MSRFISRTSQFVIGSLDWRGVLFRVIINDLMFLNVILYFKECRQKLLFDVSTFIRLFMLGVILLLVDYLFMGVFCVYLIIFTFKIEHNINMRYTNCSMSFPA